MCFSVALVPLLLITIQRYSDISMSEDERASGEHKLISLLGYGNIIFLLHVIRESIIRSNKCHREDFLPFTRSLTVL